jgi:DNA invertase Pin-like site-specific DNA recombinase
MRAAVYVRISQDREGEALGVARQERDCRRLAAAKGWDVVEVYSDNDRSAASGKPRPAWERLLADIEKGRVDALVAYSSSRCYRRPADLHRLVGLANARPGFEVATVASGKIDLSTADGRMLAGILAEVDQAEVDRLRERVTRKMRELAEMGRPAGGVRTFGYRGLEVDQEEAAAVRTAAEMILNGATLRAVARWLNGNGFTSTRGNPWTPNTVKDLLRNPRLAGLRTYHGQVVGKAAWPAILTRRTHDALVDRFAEKAGAFRNRSPRYLLTGLMTCGRCGARMVGRPQDGKPGYICAATGRVHLKVPAVPVHRLVVQLAQRVRLASPESAPDPASLSAPLLAALEAEEDRLRRWAVEAAEAGLSAREIRAGREPIAQRIAELEAELAATAAQAAPWSRLWDEVRSIPEDFEADPEAQPDLRPALESLIEAVRIAPARRGLPRFDPDRVQVAWRKGVRAS